MRAWQLVGGAMLVVASGAIAASTSVTLEVADVVPMPITGTFDGKGQTDGMLARVNSLRQEPAGAPSGASRLFLNDLNGPLYILDKASKAFSTYLDFNGRDGHTGLFHKLSFDTGFAGGFVSFQFDPDYVRNGRFYSVHIEDPALPGSNLPDNARVRGLSVGGYAVTEPVATPGETQREGVLIEWTDSNIANATFEGSARELLRIPLNTRIHPLGDLSFNPVGAPRRRRLAGALHRQRRRRIGRVAPEHPHEPAAARYARRENPAHRARSERASIDDARERERTLSHSQRQSVCRAGRRATGDLGARSTQSASPELGDRSRRRAQQPADRELHRLAHLGKPSTSSTRARTTAIPCAKATKSCRPTTKRRRCRPTT
jgi:hypothetical protein